MIRCPLMICCPAITKDTALGCTTSFLMRFFSSGVRMGNDWYCNRLLIYRLTLMPIIWNFTDAASSSQTDISKQQNCHPLLPAQAARSLHLPLPRKVVSPPLSLLSKTLADRYRTLKPSPTKAKTSGSNSRGYSTYSRTSWVPSGSTTSLFGIRSSPAAWGTFQGLEWLTRKVTTGLARFSKLEINYGWDLNTVVKRYVHKPPYTSAALADSSNNYLLPSVPALLVLFP